MKCVLLFLAPGVWKSEAESKKKRKKAGLEAEGREETHNLIMPHQIPTNPILC